MSVGACVYGADSGGFPKSFVCAVDAGSLLVYLAPEY